MNMSAVRVTEIVPVPTRSGDIVTPAEYTCPGMALSLFPALSPARAFTSWSVIEVKPDVMPPETFRPASNDAASSDVDVFERLQVEVQLVPHIELVNGHGRAYTRTGSHYFVVDAGFDTRTALRFELGIRRRHDQRRERNGNRTLVEKLIGDRRLERAAMEARIDPTTARRLHKLDTHLGWAQSATR
jgi:hypothetical protein